MQDIEKRRITGTKHAVGVHMRVRAAALTGDRVDAFNMFRAEIVKNFAHHSDAFVFFHSWFHEAIELVIGGIDHHRRRVEQCDFVLGFDFSDFVHELLAVDDFDALSLESEQHGHLDHVDADRFVVQLAFFQFQLDFFCHVFRQGGARMGRAA